MTPTMSRNKIATALHCSVTHSNSNTGGLVLSRFTSSLGSNVLVMDDLFPHTQVHSRH